jgi:hypothetical protein
MSVEQNQKRQISALQIQLPGGVVLATRRYRCNIIINAKLQQKSAVATNRLPLQDIERKPYHET